MMNGNENSVLNVFMKELVGNVQQEDLKVIMSDDNARTHDLRRDLGQHSSLSSHSAPSRKALFCGSDISSRRSSKRVVDVPVMYDTCAAPFPPTRKRYDEETTSSTFDADSSITHQSESNHRPHCNPIMVLKRSSSDNDFCPYSNRSDIGVTRWQDDAMFSSDSQLFSAPPRAPASEDSPMFVMSCKRASNRKSTAVVSPSRVSERISTGKVLDEESSSTCSWQVSSSKDHLVEDPPYFSGNMGGEMDTIEVLEEALDVVGYQRRRMLVEQ
ncbi:hypothetical protein IV203_021986 [Nitzschia inconspicua]|uniref:Uncharacterized protein n=1 Tax=Nitzschia inconspicua TaxID=303405 RepID=A0A9K3PE02_9STRA|nr:hypothetical protein IV203_021986 [Nitzschia inconspicua]